MKVEQIITARNCVARYGHVMKGILGLPTGAEFADRIAAVYPNVPQNVINYVREYIAYINVSSYGQAFWKLAKDEI